jgi:hypothetical protein
MKTGRTAVGEALGASRKHFQSTGMGSNAGRALTDLYGSMTDAMKKSLAPHADLTAQFEKANALTKDRNARFVDPKFIRSLVYKGDSQKVIGAVMRSGGEKEATALNTALEKHPVAQKSAQRAAMDYILKRSTKDATGELPGTIRPDKLDYDLAVRNAENSPALKTLLGDEGYQKFHDDLESKRLAAREPDEVRFEDYLQKVIRADTPEKAAKHAGDQANFGKLSQVNPDLATEDKGVQATEQRANAAKTAVEKLKPTVDTKGVQTVTNSIANELAPSKIIDSAAKSPEYAAKLLEVIDRAPNKDELRAQLGERIFRNVSDSAMATGAFGSADGVFDTGHFRTEYQAARPSLERILPAENLSAMDDFTDALQKYSLSRGIGGSGGMGGRFLMMRQIFAIPAIIHGIATLNPMSAAAGVAVLKGPKLWMKLATTPSITRAVTESLKSAITTAPEKVGTGTAVAASASATGRQAGSQRRDDLSRTAMSDKIAKNPANQATPAQNISAPTMEPPAGDQGNATTQNRWITNAIERAQAKTAQPPDSGSKWVTAAVDRARANSAGPAPPSTPPVSLWAGKENKRLTLRNPSNGRTEKWKLRAGVPTLAE